MPKILTKEGFNLNYEIHGDPNAKHTIIFSHGNGNSLSDWINLGYVHQLAPHYRLILMDALGHGKSDKPYNADQYTPERRAADVISVLDALKINKSHFFGSSIGGSLGFVLADLYPNRFSSFIIGRAHPYGSSQPVACNLFEKVFRDQLVSEGMEKFVIDIEEKFLHRKFHEGVRDAYLQNDPEALNAANTPIWPNRSATLKNIKVPVLLFAGALDPVSEYLPTIAKKIHNCDISILADTDHCDAFWDSAKIVPLVNQFIEKQFSVISSTKNIL